MNYAKILQCDIANGVGWRVSLFASGCDRKCKGCFNPETQDPNYGQYFDEEAKDKIFKELQKGYCQGLSLLGGEPLSYLSDNRKTIIDLCKEVKEKFPNKDIWMWSGYTFDEILNNEEMKDILKYIDYLVDGPFVESLKDTSLHWKGSANQHVLDINEYRKTGKIVEIN